MLIVRYKVAISAGDEMRRVPSNFLKIDMELASHIYAPDGRILLAKGVKLTETYIERLLEKGISYVYIEDDLSKDIIITDVIKEETRIQAKNQISKIANNISDLDYYQTKAIVGDIIDQLLTNKDILYDLEDIRSVDDYLLSHSVNVCVLSIMVGIALNYTHQQLENLAVGAILHDIGKCLIPQRILHKSGNLTDEEFEEMKNHPQYSLDILRSNNSVSSMSRIVAYQHHERYNGEGYPLGIGGKEILEMAQIVGMADMYDAITSDRCYREAMPPNEAYELLAGSGDYYFDYNLIKVFLSKLVAYPSGSMVELSNQKIAIIAKNISGFPTKPRVKVLLNSDLSLLDSIEEFNLYDHNNITITRVLKEEEITYISKIIKASKNRN